METFLRDRGDFSDADVEEATAEAEQFAADVRTRMHQEPPVDPLHLFEHVHAEPTRQLAAQRAFLAAELAEQED